MNNAPDSMMIAHRREPQASKLLAKLRSTKLRVGAALLATSFLFVPGSFAGTLTWDGNTATAGAQDGGGTWDNSAANWWNGVANVALTVQTLTATTTSSSTTLTVNSTNGLVVGQYIMGQDIPANATIASLVDATHITISSAATGGHANLTEYSAPRVIIGGNGGTAGAINLSSVQTVAGLTINPAGSGNYTFTNYALTVANYFSNNASATFSNALNGLSNPNLYLGNGVTLTLAGGGSVLAGTTSGSNVAAGLNATVLIPSGSCQPNGGAINIGDPTNRTGGIQVGGTGSIGNIGGAFAIGNAGVGFMSISAGGSLAGSTGSGQLTVSRGNTANVSRLLVNGGTINWPCTSTSDSQVQIGRDNGVGTLEVTSGTVSILGNGVTGNNGGILVVNSHVNGNNPTASGTLLISGGTVLAKDLRFNGSNKSSAAAPDTNSWMGAGNLILTNAGSLYLGGTVQWDGSGATCPGGITNRGTGTSTYSIILAGGTLGANTNWSSTLNMSLGSGGGPVNIKAADTNNTPYNIALSGVLSGSQGFNKIGGGTLTLSGANTYTGPTAISNGVLALTGSGSIASSASISIGGGTLDVSGLSSSTFNLGSSSLSATNATIKGAAGGTVNLGSQPLTLNYDGAHTCLLISQGTLVLNGNAFTVNGSPLGIGTYRLVHQASGNISSTGTFAVSGTATSTPNTTASIAVDGSDMVLTIASSITYNAYRITGGSSLSAGDSETITITAVDSGGNTATSINGPISLTFRGLGTTLTGSRASVNGYAEGSLVPLTFADGVATATLVVQKAGAATLQAGDGIQDSTGTGGTGLALTVSPGAATQLVLQTPPSLTATAGVALAAQPVVALCDASGNIVSTSASVTISASAGTLQGTTTLAADAGLATFTDLVLTTAGKSTLTFASSGLVSTSAVVNVTCNAAAQLAIWTQPAATANAGILLATQPVIAVLDAWGNLVADLTANITATNTAATGSVQGTNVVSVVNGIAAFANLFLTNVGPVTLTFTSPSLPPVSSRAVEVSGGMVAGVVWTSQPTGVVAGEPIALPPALRTVDLYGNYSTYGLFPSQMVTVTALGGGTLSGSTTADIGTAAGNGVATFTNLQISFASPATLQASVVVDLAANPATFASFGNCKLWLDAANLNQVITNTSGAVTTWADKSFNQDHAVTNSGAVVATTNSALLGNAIGAGRALAFNGSSYLSVNLNFLTNTPFTIIALEVMTNNGSFASYFLGSEGGTTDGTLHFGYRTSTNFTFAFWADDLTYNLPAGITWTSATPRIWEGKISAARLRTLYLNGAVMASGTANSFLNVCTNGEVGRANGNAYKGALSELLVYNRELSDAERSQVEAYLTNRWLVSATPITATTAPFSVAPPVTPPSLTSSQNPAGYGEPVSFTATLPAEATGSVSFLANGVAWSTNNVSGGIACSSSLNRLPRGTHLISAIYSGDANHQGGTSTLNQLVTNHPPVAAPLTVTRTAGLSLKIALSDLAAHWSDVDGDPIALQVINLVTTNGVSLIPMGLATNLDGALIVTNTARLGYPEAPNVNDQFSYTLCDGFGGTTTGYVNIVVQTGVVGTNSITRVSNGQPTAVMAYGIPGYSYILERATNLPEAVWVGISTNTATSDGAVHALDSFSDLGGQQPGAAFYRLKWQP